MILFIQIPCFNEAETLPAVIADLPTEIEGIDAIRVLVIDDGSTDETAEVARSLGVDHIVSNGRNLGLARSFSKGLDACLALGADLIVNTDGDHQYKGEEIATLIAPLLAGRADLVVGCRDIKRHPEFSLFKRWLQSFGSRVVRRLSRTDVPDTTSGFRAIGREAALRLSVMSTFSYTAETLIQAGHTGLRVAWVPVGVNALTRQSRLARSSGHYVWQQMGTIFSVYLFYCPMRFFAGLAGISLVTSLGLAARIGYFLWLTDAPAKIKTGSTTLLLFTAVTTVIFLVTGLLGSVLSGLRFLLNDLRFRVRQLESRPSEVKSDHGAAPRDESSPRSLRASGATRR